MELNYSKLYQVLFSVTIVNVTTVHYFQGVEIP